MTDELTQDNKKLTPAEALAGVKDGEELIYACCPSCNSTLAVYIRQGKVPVALGPIAEVVPDRL